MESNAGELNVSRRRDWLAILLTVVVFLVRVSSWASSDLWHDELSTLIDVVSRDGKMSLPDVFTYYPAPNNHVFFSAILWCWVRVLGAPPFNGLEWAYRFLPVLFGAMTPVAIVLLWGKWLGRRQAYLCAFIFAVSPVVTPLTYQLRGYSLSLLLATVLSTNILEIVSGSRRRGALTYVVSGALLVITVPTNILVLSADFVFVLLFRWGDPDRDLRRRVFDALPVAVGATLGAAYYLLIWRQVSAALLHQQGWDSSVAAGLNIALALLLHLGPLTVALCVWHQLHSSPESTGAIDGFGVWRLLCCLAVIAAVLAIWPTAPFPRVFAAFFPALTLSSALLVKHIRIRQTWFRPLAASIILQGMLVEFAVRVVTRNEVLAGRHPQSLVQYWYKDARYCSEAVHHLAQKTGGLSNTAVVVHAVDFSCFTSYWVQQGSRDVAGVFCTDFTDVSQWADAPDSLRQNLYALASSRQGAETMLTKLTGSAATVAPVADFGVRKLYRRQPAAASATSNPRTSK